MKMNIGDIGTVLRTPVGSDFVCGGFPANRFKGRRKRMEKMRDVVFKRVVIGGAFVESLAGELTKLNCDRVLRENPKASEAELKKCKVEEKNVRKQILYLFMVWAEVISKDATFSRAQHKLIDKIEDVLEKAIVKEKKPFAIFTKEEFDLFSTKWNAFKLWGGGKEVRIYTRALGSVIDAAEGISTVETKALFEKKGKLKEKALEKRTNDVLGA